MTSVSSPHRPRVRPAVLAMLPALVTAGQPGSTVFLRTEAHAGISSIRPAGSARPDQRGWSWCGRETLALRQNQNWAAFENKTILIRFDMTPIRGWRVEQAWLHVALAKGELHGVGACSVLADWKEGTLDGQPDPGAPSWNDRASGSGGAGGVPWAWPGSALYSVAWLHPALRYAHAGPGEIERSTDAEGVRWLRVPIDPALVHAMAIGASHGMVLTDDKGQVAEALMLERNPKPYTYDPSFEIEIHSRHAAGGSRAPRLEVTGRAVEGAAPGRPGRARRRPWVEHGTDVGIAFAAPAAADGRPCHAYRVRIAPSPITEKNWLSAAEVPRHGLPLPLQAGTEQQMRLSVPTPGTWHVAIRGVDETGCEGPLLDCRVTVPVPVVCRLPAPPAAAAVLREWRVGERLAVAVVDDLWKDDPLTGVPWSGSAAPVATDASSVPPQFHLQAARNEVVACQLILRRLGDEPPERLTLSAGDLTGPAGSTLAARHITLFREWYVRDAKKDRWAADACLPLEAPFDTHVDLPAADNVGPGQRTQAVWVDIHVPVGTAPGTYRGPLVVRPTAPGAAVTIELVLDVRPFTLPHAVSFPVELNTYDGIGAFAGVDIGRDRPRHLAIERSYYQLAHRHRCTLNILRYTHSGRITEEAVPPLAGDGAGRHIADWSAWDARFGPYLDGSAFTPEAGYEGPGQGQPLSHFYLPFHENWPMDLDRHYADAAELPDRPAFAAWASRSRRMHETVSADYQAGCTNVVADMVRHFAARGWNATRFQFFLNNKYYYKCPFFISPGLGMSGRPNGRCYWLLDEPADYDDVDANRFLLSLARAGALASGAGDVRLSYRIDASTPSMARGLLDNVVDLWCCAALPEVAATARFRKRALSGEEWGGYGGGAGVYDPPVKMLQVFLDRYAAGATFLLPYWKSFGAGWRQADHTSVYYTGHRYAGTDRTYDGALAGVRLKLMRRGQQDIEYLALLGRSRGWTHEQVVEALAAWTGLSGRPQECDFTQLSADGTRQLRAAIAEAIENAPTR